MINLENLKKGANNLLRNCADISDQDTLLIISEDPALSWYEKDISDAVSEMANNMGIKTKVLEVGGPQNDSKNKLTEIINDFDCTIFFARIGDQDRFDTSSFKTKRVMSYARSVENLASKFGRTHHQSLIELKKAINTIFSNGGSIQVSCPLGTNISGEIPNVTIDESADVGVLRFPMLVPTPVSAKNFSGEVVLTKFLTPSRSKVYDPPSLELKKDVICNVEKGKILGFEGDSQIVQEVKNHYNHISELFDIERDNIDSWHAGIHPGTYYEKTIAENPDRWSNTIFGSPRFLHFHTCGNYSPGEICWMVENHTVKIDGVPLWENGILKIFNFLETKKCVDNWVELQQLFIS